MNCRYCGQLSTSQTAFCTACGRNQELQSTAYAAPSMGGAGSFADALPATPVPVYIAADDTPYAEFFTRFFAFVIDTVIAGALAAVTYGGVMLMAVLVGLGSMHGRRGAFSSGAGLGTGLLFAIAGFLLAIAVYTLYFVMQETSPRQATIGKYLLGMRVTTMSGNTVGMGQSLGRLFIKSTFSMLFCLVGFFIAVFTKKKQALHDFAANTIVLKR